MSNTKSQTKEKSQHQTDQRGTRQNQFGAVAKQGVRRKILIGSYFLHKAKEEDSVPELYRTVKNYLKRPGDLSLFDE